MGGELMNYYWMYANDTTGTLAPQHSTQAPYDSTGKFDSSLLPSGNSVLGPYDDSGKNNMPADFQTAYDNPQAWLYQNGAYANNPNYATIQLAQAKTTQSALVTEGYNATLIGGFTSNTTGHTYATDSLSSARIAAKATQLLQDTSITSIPWMTKDAGEVTHTRTEFLGVFDDGIAWERAQYTQKGTLLADIQSATSVSSVQTFTWSEVSY